MKVRLSDKIKHFVPNVVRQLDKFQKRSVEFVSFWVWYSLQTQYKILSANIERYSVQPSKDPTG